MTPRGRQDDQPPSPLLAQRDEPASSLLRSQRPVRRKDCKRWLHSKPLSCKVLLRVSKSLRERALQDHTLHLPANTRLTDWQTLFRHAPSSQWTT